MINKGILKRYIGSDENVVIPDSVSSIGEYAFYGCCSLESIAIPDGIRSIEDNTFAFSLAQLTCEHVEELDAIINENSVGWKVERLPKVSLAILRLALCEILYIPSIPNGVSINEAVELAKKFSSSEDASFINGILGKYVRENLA